MDAGLLRKWLGLPPGPWPPDDREILGLPAGPADPAAVGLQALAQMDLRRKINLLIGEWKAAGGGDVLPNVRDRVRLRPTKTSSISLRVAARR